MVNIAIFASGSGSNAENISNYFKNKEGASVSLIISNKADALVHKRAEVLGIITKDTFCFAVAGTHGKTTTSSILGHILYESGADVTAFLGGIVENYNSNLIGNGKTKLSYCADKMRYTNPKQTKKI